MDITGCVPENASSLNKRFARESLGLKREEEKSIMTVDGQSEATSKPHDKTMSLTCRCKEVQCKIEIIPPEPEKNTFLSMRKLTVFTSFEYESFHFKVP